MRTPTRIFAGITVAAALVLSGCNGGDSTEKPTEASTPTPTADPAQEAQDEAFEAIQGMHKSFDDVAKDGWKDLGPLDDYAKGDVADAEKEFGTQYKEKGQFGTGETVLSDYKATDVDVTEKSVDAKVCVDTTQRKLHNSDGSEVKLKPQIPLKAVKTYTVEFDQVKDKWMVVKYDSAGDEPC
ncbi:hypothetical protein [Brevibacterium sp. 2SA]|uniref:hypothetical protein n=1 Tax=Brevibacterium sp. 2SA TaxID=2502198 RepID=UPI0010F4A631|nr:hypothetical protein [Brevibacterium sp. 2SA]